MQLIQVLHYKIVSAAFMITMLESFHLVISVHVAIRKHYLLTPLDRFMHNATHLCIGFAAQLFPIYFQGFVGGFSVRICIPSMFSEVSF